METSLLFKEANKIWDKLNSEYVELGQPYIQTFSGIKFTFLNPTSEMIEIEDIAHSLSMSCRYGGHCWPFYSVAKHSLIMSYLVSPENALAALLHDAPEFVLKDLPSPIKNQMPIYIDIENKLYSTIADKYNIPLEIPEEVHKIDRAMIGLEWDFFMEKNSNPNLNQFYDAHFFTIKPMMATKKQFLDRFHELYNKQLINSTVSTL